MNEIDRVDDEIYKDCVDASYIRGIIEGLKLAQHINSIAVTDYDYSTKLQSAIDAVQWLSRKDL